MESGVTCCNIESSKIIDWSNGAITNNSVKNKSHEPKCSSCQNIFHGIDAGVFSPKKIDEQFILQVRSTVPLVSILPESGIN